MPVLNDGEKITITVSISIEDYLRQFGLRASKMGNDQKRWIRKKIEQQFLKELHNAFEETDNDPQATA